jgi:hypothetical protein
MVIPPARILEEYGQLGHTLSTGPSHRLSHGLLMPLFPSVYAQLTAIAKEWAFPSTVGLCLYMHITENGMAFTPRILDDTWQLLWHHVLDPAAPSTGLPIAGRIEFDIDMVRARWFSSWTSTRVMEPVVVAPSCASRDFSTFSQKDRSLDMSIGTDIVAKTEEPTPTTRPRHVPKTLSLVERYDAFLPKTPAAKTIAAGLPDPEPTPSIPFLTLPPAAASNKDLTMKVNQWRTSAMEADEGLNTAKAVFGSVVASDEEAKIEVEVEVAKKELNMADFSWSPSTAGPPTKDHDSPSPVVIKTPFPDRYGPGDCSASPSKAQSHNLLSPRGYPSFDLYPSTDAAKEETTEAVSSSYPYLEIYTPVYPHAAPYVSGGLEYSQDAKSVESAWTRQSPATYPDFNIYPAVGYPFFDLYPVFDGNSLVKDKSHQNSAEDPIYPWLQIYKPVYPNVEPYPSVAAETNSLLNEPKGEMSFIVSLSAGYPHFDLYPAVGYPYFNLYPCIHAASQDDGSSNPAPIFDDYGIYPWLQIYAPVYPNVIPYPSVAVESHSQLEESSSEVGFIVSQSAGYPHFNLYPADEYPYFNLYPETYTSCKGEEPERPAHDFDGTVSYPWFQLHAPVYPHIVPYPAPACCEVDVPIEICDISSQETLKSEHDVNYPWFQIYTPVYPHLEPYPVLRSAADPWVSSFSSASYPDFDLYPSCHPTASSSFPIPRPQATSLRARSKSISTKRQFMVPLNTTEDPWPEHSLSATIPPLSSSNGVPRSGKKFDKSPLPTIPITLGVRAPTPAESTHRRHKSEIQVEKPLQRSVSHLRTQSAKPVVTMERNKSTSSPRGKRDSLTLTIEKLRKARSLIPGSTPSASIPTSSREVSVFEDYDDDQDWARY